VSRIERSASKQRPVPPVHPFPIPTFALSHRSAANASFPPSCEKQRRIQGRRKEEIIAGRTRLGCSNFERHGEQRRKREAPFRNWAECTRQASINESIHWRRIRRGAGRFLRWQYGGNRVACRGGKRLKARQIRFSGSHEGWTGFAVALRDTGRSLPLSDNFCDERKSRACGLHHNVELLNPPKRRDFLSLSLQDCPRIHRSRRSLRSKVLELDSKSRARGFPERAITNCEIILTSRINNSALASKQNPNASRPVWPLKGASFRRISTLLIFASISQAVCRFPRLAQRKSLFRLAIPEGRRH